MQDLAHNFLELKDKTLKLNVGVLSEGSCLLIWLLYSIIHTADSAILNETR